MKTLFITMLIALSASLGIVNRPPAKGELAPDITLRTVDNQVINLSSLRGKVVLLDFWASWCRPCRAEIAHVVLPAYAKYRDKGFEVYAVSLDTQEAAWKRAVAAHQMPWVNVSDLQGYRSPIMQNYQLTKIPSSFLLDEEGKVIAVDLRGRALLDKLEEVLN